MDKDKLKNMLDYLGLTYLRDEYPAILDSAVKKQISLQDFLIQIIKLEALKKQERSIARRIQQAHFPNKKSMETFDWTFPEKINEELVHYLFKLDFVAQKGNVAFLGPTGVGKTHLMTALGLHACNEGYTVLFDTAANIINKLAAAQADGKIIQCLKLYKRPDILCIDEIGYLPIGQLEANLFFQVISSRYETGSIILTSNIGFKEWVRIFNNDAALTSAILDRVIHHCDIVTIEGRSFRLNGKKQ